MHQGYVFPKQGTYITRSMCFPGGGTDIARDMCFLDREHTSPGMCFPGRGRHISRDMCFPGGRTHVIRDMCFLSREYISLGVCVSQVEEQISLGICVSQVGNTHHQGYVFPREKPELYNFILILLLFVCLKHDYFVQLSHLYLTEFCSHSKLDCYFKFQLIKNPDLSALIIHVFGLTGFS